ncbi:hypothetical protein ACFYZE_15855 [Streptomyces sp. NPDC001796]|uniref:hypothetical protein n=1 Tax=Streptomyces sp. NPDC001796 TaxID=3364609 RepID=UPI0036A1A092
MLVIEILQVVVTIAVLVMVAERQVARPLLLCTAVGFGTSQIVTALDGSLADSFFRLFVAVFATLAVERWKTQREAPAWAAGGLALVCGLVLGWVA